MRRKLLSVVFLTAYVMLLPGCSNRGYELDKDKTIAYDEKIHGKPFPPAGGPGGGLAAGGPMSGKGKVQGSAANSKK
jgi:hypothetical protein